MSCVPSRKRLESDNGNDMVSLAESYAAGETWVECDDEAFELYLLVGEKGGAKVMYALAMCHQFGWGTATNSNAAISCYARAAELGSFEALERLKNIKSDESAEPCIEQVWRRFSLKSESGDPAAQFNAGFCHFYGIGTPEHKEEARSLFLRAADENHADAVYMLELCLLHSVGDGYRGLQGIGLIKKAADMGSAKAEFQLGYAFYNGKTTYGLEAEKSPKQAVEWFKEAADEELPEAVYYLADCYYYGIGARRDLKKAFRLWEKAALMGSEGAENCLSDFYEQKNFQLSGGEWPAEIDYCKAAYWNGKTADEGHGKYKTLDILEYISLNEDEIEELQGSSSQSEAAEAWRGIAKQCEKANVGRAIGFYRLAARLGSLAAKIDLGKCYDTRIGCVADLNAAVHWYEKAAFEGVKEAAELLLYIICQELADVAEKSDSTFTVLAGCYEVGCGVRENEDAALRMREHAAIEGDSRQASSVLAAYISGRGNEYRARRAGAIAARTSNLPSVVYLQFFSRFRERIDELDGLATLLNAANSIRAESLGMCVDFQ